MHDRIPSPGKAGRMLITPEDGSPAFYATVTMADEPTQEGTLLSKATVLSDPTAVKFGLGSAAVPNDVFSWLGNYNEHWWRKRSNLENGGYVAKEEPYYGSGATFFISDHSQVTITASEFYAVNFETGEISLTNPITVTSMENGSLDSGKISSLRGKYCKGLASAPDKIIFLRADASIETQSNSYGEVSVRVNSGYGPELVSVFVSDKAIGEWEFLRSFDRTAYPDSGIENGYEYQYLGVPFQNAVIAPKIVTGSYEGTGTEATAENPLTFTVDFQPKMLIIIPGKAYAPSGSMRLIAINPQTNAPVAGSFESTTHYRANLAWDENSVSIVGATGPLGTDYLAGASMNQATVPYFYLIAG